MIENKPEEFKMDMYGYPKVEEYNPNNGGVGTIVPIRTFSKVVPVIPPVMEIPYAISPDEVFVPVTPVYTNEAYGRYIVSNYGRIYDFAYRRFIPSRYNDKYQSSRLNCGYLVCHLSRYINPKEQESKDYYVHRIVLMSFNYIPGCEDTDKLEVNHKNGVTGDNRLCNLEWVTPKENIKNAMKWLGRTEFLLDPSEQLIHKICEMLDHGMHPYTIAEMTKVHLYYIQGLLDGSRARDIACKYNFYEKVHNIYPDTVIHYICQRIAQGISARQISSEIGINKYFIKDIYERKIYTRISSQYSFMNSNIEDDFNNKLPTQTVREICRLFSLGYSISDVINIFKTEYDIELTMNQLYKIKSGNTYTNVANTYNLEYSKRTIESSIIRAVCIDMQNGMSNVDIANKYDIDRATIAHIRRGETYSDISKDYNFMSAFESNRLTRVNSGKSLSDETITNICELLMQKLTPTEVAERTGVKVAMVNSIKSKNIYPHITNNYDFPLVEKRLDEATVRSICNDIFVNRMRNIEVIDKYNLASSTVKRIKSGKMHKDISKDYIQ